MTDGFSDPVAEDDLRRLQAACGTGWMIWYVPCCDGRRRWLTWCAKRLADGAPLHATQPEHLAEYIAAANQAAAAAAEELIWQARRDTGH